MNRSLLLAGLCALSFLACSSEPASDATTPPAAAATTDAQAALVLDKVP